MVKGKIVEDPLEKYKAVFLEGIYPKIILNNKAEIIEVNPAGIKFFGAEYHQKKLFDYMPTKSPKEMRRFWKKLRVGGQNSERIEFSINKRRFVFLVNATTNIQKDVNLLILDDVTKDVVEQESRDQFIAIAGHELKTPLAVIKAYSELLQRKYQEDEKTKQYTRKVIDKVDLLTKLVNAIVDEIKLGAGRLEFNDSELNMYELITKQVEDFRKIYPKFQFIVEGNSNSHVVADAERLAQVVSNLVTNAVKYSKKGKKVTIHITDEKDKLCVGVQDFGTGISKKEQTKLFNAFYRGPSVIKKNYSGIGLGLFIAKQIVTYYKGEMWVESKWGKGSTFYFTLPTI